MATRIGVLVSGAGVHLQALAEAIRRGELPASIELVVGNDGSSGGLAWAQRAGLRTALFDRQELAGRSRRHEAARRVLEAAEVDLVVAADFDEPPSRELVGAYAERLVGAVPCLLPAFADATDPVGAALELGVKVAGCSVYLLAPDSRHGPILAQRAIEVREVETRESLAERLEVESQLALVSAVRLLAAGRVRLEGERARIV